MFEAFAAAGAYAPATLPAGLAAQQNIAVLRLASAGWIGTVGGAPALYQPRLVGDVELSVGAMDALGLGGRAALAVAIAEADDVDGLFADLARYDTATGRAVAIRTAAVLDAGASDAGTDYAATSVAFAGVVASIDRAANRRARITVADATDRLNTPLQPTLYSGTGGLEGQADLKGRPKPVALGRCFNVAPVYLGNIDLGAGALPTYQTHWRGIQAHTSVRIRGVTQTLVGGIPTVGQARDWPGYGAFQLGGSPDGAVTADVQGDAAGGYVEAGSAVLRRLLESLGGGFTSSDFDSDAWSAATADLPGAIGFYQGADVTSAQAAAEAILAGCGAILAGDRQGRLRLVDPFSADTTAQFDIQAWWIVALEPLPLPAAFAPLPRAIEIAWGRNWSPASDIAGAVTAADRARLASPQSVARAESTTVTSRVALQRSLSLPGLYADEAAAQARANRLRDWTARGPQAFRLVTDRYLGQMEVGMLGRIAYPAYGLDAGIFGVVVAYRERIAARRLEITLVGVPG
jgi:hypothetical protein